VQAGLSGTPLSAPMVSLPAARTPYKDFLAACLVMFAAVGLRPITSHRTIATTLPAAGACSDNSPARAMSSMECSVMYFE
jgi:hypothetical protein